MLSPPIALIVLHLQSKVFNSTKLSRTSVSLNVTFSVINNIVPLFMTSPIWQCSLSLKKHSRFQKVNDSDEVQFGLEGSHVEKLQLCLPSTQSRSYFCFGFLNNLFCQLQVVTYTEYILQLSGNNIAHQKPVACHPSRPGGRMSEEIEVILCPPEVTQLTNNTSTM